MRKSWQLTDNETVNEQFTAGMYYMLVRVITTCMAKSMDKLKCKHF